MSLRVVVVTGVLLAFGVSPLRADSWQPIGPKAGATFSVTVHPSNSNINLLSGYFYGASRTYRTVDGGQTLTELPIVDSEMFFDPVNENRVYALAGHLRRSDDAGATWDEISMFSVSAAAVAPGNTNRLYAAEAGSNQMYTSIDAGASWTPITVFAFNSRVYPLAVDPFNPEIVFAGTYGQFGGEGLFKSTNAGYSWTKISPPILSGNVSRIAIDPSDPLVVYCATTGDGLLLKSTDGGTTWDQISLPDGDVTEVLLDPQHAGRVYVLVNYSLHVSHDAGGSWAPVPAAPNGWVADIDLMRTDTDVLVVASDGVLVSKDAGASFTHWGVEPIALTHVLVDRTNRDHVCATGNGLYRTTDAAATWDRVGNTGFGNVIAQDPVNAGVLFNGAYSGGGIEKSIDGGATWSLSLGEKSINDVAVAPGNSSIVFACGLYQTSPGEPSVRAIFKSANAGASWTVQDNLFSQTIVVHPLNEAIVYAGGSNGVSKSIDGGTTWTPTNNGLDNPASGTVMDIVIDPTDPETLYAATINQGVYKSLDGGVQWTRLTSPMTDVRAIEIDPVDAQVVYAAAYSQGIFVSVNGGLSWSTLGVAVPGRTGITVDPFDRNTLYMAGSGVWKYVRTTPCAVPAIESHQPESIVLSECEAGCTLTFTVGTPDDYSQAAVVALERKSGEAWIQEDAILAPLPAAPWQLSRVFQPGDAPGNHVFRVVIRGMDGSRATSGEQSVEVFSTPTGVTPPAAFALTLEQNQPNPFNPSTTISFQMPRAARARVAVYDVNGTLVAVLLDRLAAAGNNHVVWNGRNASGNPVSSGVYFYRLTAVGQNLTRRMVLLK